MPLPAVGIDSLGRLAARDTLLDMKLDIPFNVVVEPGELETLQQLLALLERIAKALESLAANARTPSQAIFNVGTPTQE